MKHLLGIYMAVLAALLIAAVCIGLLSIGRISSPKSELTRTLQTQMDFFRDDMRSLWQNVATSGVHLSVDMADILEQCLAQREVDFEELTGDIDSIAALEDAMLEPLCQYVRQTHCSGAFVVMNTAMRTDSAPDVRSGLCVQKNNAERQGNELLLFRGMSSVSKAHDVMPHRKWQQEFHVEQFPNYDECLGADAASLWDACRITELFTLPGTSERAVLLTVPLVGREGRVYGVCGFSVNQTYFCAHYEQPSDLSRLACIIASDTGDELDVSAGLVTYTRDGSCTLPDGVLTVSGMGSELCCFEGEGYSFVGKIERASFTQEGSGHTLAVLIPKSDYDRAVRTGAAQTAVFAFLLVFFVVACCAYFARRYLRPVYEDMKRLQREEPSGMSMSFKDFEPLNASMTAREESHKAIVSSLRDEKELLQSRYEESRSQLEEAHEDVRQLASRRRDELDPEEYEMFLMEYRRFSDKQKLVVNDMVDGLSPQESADHLQYQKSTIYSYRRDVYDRLNITGKDKLQQLRLRVALMRQEEELTAGKQDAKSPGPH